MRFTSFHQTRSQRNIHRGKGATNEGQRLRDIRIILEDGSELAAEVSETGADGETTEAPQAPGPWEGSATGKIVPEGESLLRYWLWVRRWLYCPVEFRRN